MKSRRTILTVVLLSVFGAGASTLAQAQTSREQVQAELREAIRNGDIVSGEDGLTRYERNPSAYPVRPVLAGKTRNQVKAELREAVRVGDIADGEDGRTRYEHNPSAYPARVVLAGKTRGEVKAELAEAVRTGDLVVGESSQTLSQLFPGNYPKRSPAARASSDTAHAASRVPEGNAAR
jgi:ribosomal protein L30E